MMQPSDHELDKIIKEASDQHKAPGANPDWDKMQALLDVNMPVRKGPRRFGFIFWSILLFLLAGGAYIFFTNNNPKTFPSVKKQQPQASVKPVNATLSPGVNTVAETPTNTENKTNTLPLNETIKLLPVKGGLNEENKKVSGYKSGTKNKTKQGGKLILNKYAGEIAQDNMVAKAPANKTFAETNDRETAALNEVLQPSVATAPLSLNNQSPEKKVTTVAANAIKDNTADTTKTLDNKKKKPSEKRRSPLEITLVYAPELTSIGFSHIDKPGSNYGLLLGYHLSKNTTLQTGFIQSRKNYIADGDDYNLGYPQTASHKLTKVNGYCMMYEIPLNIKSKIYTGKKVNWFFTAGISSYFMKRQFYTYHYATATGGYDKSVTYNSQRNYWFALANVGAGIEKKISDNFTIAAAPFLKIPFKGMGEGKLKLLSTGINFSLTYQPGYIKKVK